MVGMLVDINLQKVSAVESETNPQTAFGADVISRIQVAHASPDGLKAESKAIRRCLNRIIEKLCTTTKVSVHDIYTASIADNSTCFISFCKVHGMKNSLY